MDQAEPVSGRNEMCNAFIFIYPAMKAPRCHSDSSNARTWGKRHLGWNQTSQNILLSPVMVGNTTFVNEPSFHPLKSAEFWKGKDERVRSFEEDGEVQPFEYTCGDQLGVTYKHMVKKQRNP